MKKVNLLFLALIGLFFVACDSNNDTDGDWAKSVEFGGGNRVCAVSFTDPKDGDVYIGMGFNSTLTSTADQNMKDFWVFRNGSWNKVVNGDFPVEGRSGSVAFVVDRIAYVGAGYRAAFSGQPDNVYFSDFYLFDLDKEEWIKEGDAYKTIDIATGMNLSKDDCAFYGGIAFTHDGRGYVGTGQLKDRVSKSIFCYDPKTNTWSDAEFPGDSRVGAVTFTIDNRTVLCLGASGGNRLDVWVFDGAWQSKEPLVDRDGKWNDDYDEIPRSYAVAFTAVDGSKTKGYIACGTGNRSCWEYDIDRDRWDEVTEMASGMLNRLGGIGFSYGNYGYVTTGGSGITNSTDNSTWVFYPGIDEDDDNDY